MKSRSPSVCCSQSDEVHSAMFKALGHPVRFMMVKQLLMKKSCCCGELCDCFDQSQSTVSQHLAVLKDAGILSSHREGNRMLYFIERETLQKLSEALAELSAFEGEGRLMNER